MFKARNMKKYAVTFLVCNLLLGLAFSSMVRAEIPEHIDVSFDDCVAVFAKFGREREVDFSPSVAFEWICSFLLHATDTGNLYITMSHEQCVYVLLSNLWRLEIVAQIGRDICGSLAYLTEMPSLLTPEPTRTTRTTRTPTPLPYTEVICVSEDHSRALRKALIENNIYAYLSHQAYEGRKWARVVTHFSTNNNLSEIISSNGLDCSIPEQAR